MSENTISNYELKYKKQGINYRIRRLASMLARYEKQFNRMKNFTRDQWKTYIRDVRRCEQLNSVLQRQTRQTKLDKIRLTQLVTPPPNATEGASTSTQSPGTSSDPAPSSASGAAPSSSSTANYYDNPSTSGQLPSNIQPFHTPSQTTSSFGSETLGSGVNYTQVNSESIGISGLYHTPSVSGSFQYTGGPSISSMLNIGSTGIFRTGPSGYLSNGPEGIIEPSGSTQSIGPAGIVHTNPSGLYQSVRHGGIIHSNPGPRGILRVNSTSSFVSIGPLEIHRGCINRQTTQNQNINSNAISIASNSGLTTYANVSSGTGQLQTSRTSAFVPYPTRNVTSSQIIDLTDESDDSD